MGESFLAAAVQVQVGNDKPANLDKAEALVRAAARAGAALVVLPELFSWGGPRDQEAVAAEAIPGPTSERLAGLAHELRIHLVAGSFLERIDGHAKVYNTCAVFNPSGKLIGLYRKAHLFDVEISGQVTVRESDTRLAGGEVVAVSTELAPLGLGICYDLRFPELFRHLTAAGAELICLPSAFTFTTGAAHWEVLVRARAIENQVYLIAPNQFGRGASGILNFGNSLIVDPWGTPIARAGDGETFILGEIDLAYLARVRREIPCLAHRKFGISHSGS
jgi:predicted amidohydrolase